MGLNEVTALMAVLVMALVARGFIPLVLPFAKNDVLTYLSRGVTILIGAIILRLAYWDWAHDVGSNYFPDLWSTWLAMSKVRAVNIVPNLMIIAAGYNFLKARWLLIPDEDRDDWSLLTAPFYPARHFVTVGLSKVTNPRKKK